VPVTLRRVSACFALVVAALAAASIGSAGSTAFGVPQTRACLQRQGATFNAITPGVAHSGLTAAQQAEVLSGTLPAGGSPVFFFLVVGRNASDAAAVLKVLRSDFPIGTRWSSAKGNAAWALTSITGPVGSKIKSTFLSCLRVGAPPTGVAPSPSSYTMAAVGSCLAALSNGAVVRPADLKHYVPLVFAGMSVPASVLPHTLLVYTATNPSSRDGVGIFIVFGRHGSDAAVMRGALERALGIHRVTSRGLKKNAAWVAFRLKPTTSAGRKAGLNALSTCLN
jgi:hypothetical protein